MINEIQQEFKQLSTNPKIKGTNEEIASELAHFHVDLASDSQVMLLCVNYEIYTATPFTNGLANVSLITYARECLKQYIFNLLVA